MRTRQFATDLAENEHRRHEARIVDQKQAVWGPAKVELITRHADEPCHASMRASVHVVCLFCDDGWTGVVNRIDDGTPRRLGLLSGRIRIVPAGRTLHSFWQRGKRTYLLVFIDPDFLSDMLKADHPDLDVYLKEQINLRNEELERILLSMRDELERPGLSSNRMGEALVRQLAIGLLRLLSGNATPIRGGLRPSQLRAVTGLIERQLGDPLSVGALAKRTGLSEHHFAHAFRKSIGESPYRYILQRRLELASSLLAETELALTEIALRAGFLGSSQFSNAFRRHFGVSPRDWRRSK